MAGRRLSADEAALWRRVLASVRPMPGKRVSPPQPLTLTRAPAAPAAPAPVVRPVADRKLPRAKPSVRIGETLDGAWDRRLARGLVSPDTSIDLHGHGLASAYDVLDQELARAIDHGARVVLLVTGKPPRPESERPHARGAIRAAVGDWLAGSRHAHRIAAVRGAHPRHGGAGALYIVLRRDREVS